MAESFRGDIIQGCLAECRFRLVDLDVLIETVADDLLEIRNLASAGSQSDI